MTRSGTLKTAPTPTLAIGMHVVHCDALGVRDAIVAGIHGERDGSLTRFRRDSDGVLMRGMMVGCCTSK